MFKKKKIKSKKNKKKNIGLYWIISVFLSIILGIFVVTYAGNIHFFGNLKNTELNDNLEKKGDENIEKKKEEEKKKKEDDNKINILLLWRWWNLNDAPDLTDSIILASVNKKLKTISMFSIPRDLYVKYKSGRYWKINKAYAAAKAKTWSVEAWIDAIKYNVELLTGEKIDYYVNIDFRSFISFVDAIGWVEITVPKTLVDRKFPDNNWWYRTFIIKKWTWLFTWEEALNYARSRHSTSDFDRSMRQQQIIQAIKKKLTSWWFFEKLSKAKKFYDVFKKYVITDIWLSDAVTIFNEIKDNNFKIVSSNLNDSCFEWDPFCSKWWFLYTPERERYGWASVLLVNWSWMWKINNYMQVKKYIDLVFNNPDIFKENIDISILNSTKVPLLAWNTAFELRRYGFNIPFNKNSLSTLKGESIDKSFINYNKSIKNSSTLKYLKNIFPDIIFKEVEDLEYSPLEKAQIEIIIGKDYDKIFNDLKNNL